MRALARGWPAPPARGARWARADLARSAARYPLSEAEPDELSAEAEPNPEETVAAAAAVRRLLSAIDSLRQIRRIRGRAIGAGERRRMVELLSDVYCEGLTIRAHALKRGVSRKAATARHERAIAALREMMR